MLNEKWSQTSKKMQCKIKRHLLLRRKAMTNLDSVLKRKNRGRLDLFPSPARPPCEQALGSLRSAEQPPGGTG